MPLAISGPRPKLVKLPKNSRPSTLIASAILTVFAATSLTACSSTRVPASSQSTVTLFCQAYIPVRWSKADTDETIVQVKANNAVFTALCK
jgi:uncharacterized lipoprotein YmbA